MLPVYVQLESRHIFWSILMGTQQQEPIIQAAKTITP